MISLGLGTTKRTTTVGASWTRMIDLVQDLPNTPRDAILDSVFTNTDLTETLIEYIVNGLPVQINRMFNYARDEYTEVGLPRLNPVSASDVQSNFTDFFNDYYGTHPFDSTPIDHQAYGDVSGYFLGWYFLKKKFYDPYTFQAPPYVRGVLRTFVYNSTYPVYLQNITLAAWQPAQDSGDPSNPIPFEIGDNYLNHVITDPKNVITPYNPTGNEINPLDWNYLPEVISQEDWGNGFFYYVATEEAQGFLGEPITIKQRFFLSKRDIDITRDWLTDSRRIFGNDGAINEFAYEIGSGGIEELDLLNIQGGEDFNFNYFPMVHLRLRKTNLFEEPEDETEMFKQGEKILNFIGIDIKELGETLKDNPDLSDIETASFGFFISLRSTEPLDVRYNFEYFNYIIPRSGQYFNLFRTDSSLIQITDSKMNVGLEVWRLTRDVFLGNIGQLENINDTPVSVGEYQVVETVGDGVTAPPGEINVIWRKQTSENEYVQIEIKDVISYFNVRGTDYRGTFREYPDGEVGTMLVPLSMDVLKASFSFVQRERIVARAMGFVATTRVITKTRWYNRSAFIVLVQIVAVIVTILSAGAAFKTILAAGSLTAAAKVFLTTVLRQIIISTAFKALAREIGVDAALAVALSLTVAGIARGVAVSDFRDGLADNLVMAGMNLEQAAVKTMQMELKDLQSISEQLREEYKEFIESLPEIEDTSVIDGTDFLRWRPIQRLNEEAADYLLRTAQFNDFGVQSLEAAKYYFDNALQLPDLIEQIEMNRRT